MRAPAMINDNPLSSQHQVGALREKDPGDEDFACQCWQRFRTALQQTAIFLLMSSPSSSSSSPISSPLTFEFFQQLAGISSQQTHPQQESFFKCIKTSPDGAYLLTSTEDHVIEVHEIDESLVQNNLYYKSTPGVGDEVNISSDDKNAITRGSRVRPGESIYDIQWYPYARKTDPASSCFISTCRDKPIQLFGSQDSLLRGSYCIMNAQEELEPAICCSFNMSGDKIFGGSTRLITSFDVSYPGKNGFSYSTVPLKGDPNGQRGVMSTMAFNPDMSRTFAVGTFANCVGIYTEDVECVLQINDLEFGVTHVKWSQCGNYLYVGGRKNDNILKWDVRNTREEVGRFSRTCGTNQKYSFDLDPWGKFLATGNQEGQILVYDTTTFDIVKSSGVLGDCVNSVSFHPFSSVIFSCTGQRHFQLEEESSDDEEESKVLAAKKCFEYVGSGIQVHKMGYNPLRRPEQ